MTIDKSKIIGELDFLTEMLSSRSREISIGVAAFCWTGLIFPEKIGFDVERIFFFLPLTLALFSLTLDLLQYLFATFSAYRSYKRSTDGKFIKDVFFHLRMFCFYGKIFWSIMAVLSFGICLLQAMKT